MDKENISLALPNEEQFRQDIQAINRFQQVVHANMVKGQDYGVIPGTQKPTLLKPGAEKIAKLLGLADQYEILEKEENWDKPFFHYLVSCKLMSVVSGIVISEGLGECNSMESKYRWRWVFPSDVPQGMERDKLATREINTKRGRTKQYRLENEDIYSQVNTILKMSKKRALVDAALSAGRLSNVFTQDVEDLPNIEATEKSEVTRGFESPEVPVEQKPDIKDVSEATTKIDVTRVVPTRDAESINTITGLFQACHTDFKLQPKQVLAELNVRVQSEITELPADCYRRIAASRA